MPDISTKRIYDPPTKGDGFRVLVDRLWPRGLKKEDAEIDLWVKEIAPSTELRKWFDHDPDKFAEFGVRYCKELDASPDVVERLVEKARDSTVTLLYAARDTSCNHAVVLRKYLLQTHYS